MSIPNNSNSIANTLIQVQTAIDNGGVLATIKDGAVIRQQAEIDSLRAALKSGGSGGGVSLSQYKESQFSGQLSKLKQESVDQRLALIQKDQLISEWMITNEAFKRLSRKYGKEQGLSDAQIEQDLNNEVLSIAEEDPVLAKTKAASNAKNGVGAQPGQAGVSGKP